MRKRKEKKACFGYSLGLDRLDWLRFYNLFAVCKGVTCTHMQLSCRMLVGTTNNSGSDENDSGADDDNDDHCFTLGYRIVENEASNRVWIGDKREGRWSQIQTSFICGASMYPATRCSIK